MDSAVPVPCDPVAGQAQTSSLSSRLHGWALQDGECGRGRCLLWGGRGWADSQVPWRWGRCRPKCTGLCRAAGQAHLQRWAGRSKAGNAGTGQRRVDRTCLTRGAAPAPPLAPVRCTSGPSVGGDGGRGGAGALTAEALAERM